MNVNLYLEPQLTRGYKLKNLIKLNKKELRIINIAIGHYISLLHDFIFNSSFNATSQDKEDLKIARELLKKIMGV